MMMRTEGWVFSLITFLLVAIAEGSELRLRFKDQQGEKVRLSKAELLLVAWGVADRLDLETKGEDLILPLDESWLRSRWSNRFMDMEKVYLFLQAEGYAAVRSHPFVWFGAHGPPHGPRVVRAEVAFPGGKRAVVKEGETAELEIVFRRPRERYLRFIDDHGRPVSRVAVSSYMFWSASNHCGYLAGADPLGRAVSDRNGRVPVPDGDFEYAFILERPLYVLKHPIGFPYSPPRLVTYLDAEETLVEMHRWRRRSLEMRVTKNGRPIEGQWLYGWRAGCPCGACWGPVGKTGKEGRISMRDFYPEEWEVLFFMNEKEERIWEAKPTKWARTGTIHIELDPNR